MTVGLENLHQQGYQTEYQYTRGYDAVVNSLQGAERISEVVSAILGARQLDSQCEPESWAEDFTYYLQQRPGGFFLLGSANPIAATRTPLHSSTYHLDEIALAYGAAIMAGLIIL